MRKTVLTLLCLLLVGGCMSPSKLRKENAVNIANLSVGMSKQQVLDIMGSKSASQDQTTITNPYRINMIHRNDKTYQVMYYYTQKNRISPPFAFGVREDDLTPLYFLDGKLVGWGKSFWP